MDTQSRKYIEDVKKLGCKARLEFKVEATIFHVNLGKGSEGMMFFLKEYLYGVGKSLRKWDLWLDVFMVEKKCVWGSSDSCKLFKMISRTTVGSVFVMNDLKAPNEILEVEDIRECRQL